MIFDKTVAGDFPAWKTFTSAYAAEALPRFLEAAEREVAELEKVRPDTYDALVPVLDAATRDLWTCWGRVSHMLGVMNAPDWRQLEESWQERIVAFALRVAQSPVLHACHRAALAAESHPVRRRILEKAVQAAEHSGVALVGEARERFNRIQAELARLGSAFHNAVIDATAAFSLEKDGHRYTIDDAAYVESMKHCPDRDVRERLMRARSARAPENDVRIGEILRLRRESAALLGYASYAELSLAAKCAPSVPAVFEMIDRLDAATVVPAAREETELAASWELAELAPWDRTFASERLREKKYAYSEDELKRYFELEDVLRGLFGLVKFLFGVEVSERTGSARPDVWHEDVRVFAVCEDGREIAHFYFDPFVRSGLKGGGAWMNEFRNRRRVCDAESGAVGRFEMPLAVIVTNFPARGEDGKCHLPLRDVETLFHEFGHALQCMLTRVDEEDAAGINLVEHDAVEVASQFMENWCLDAHTGLRIPSELRDKVRRAKNFRAATACRRQLAFAKTDLVLHGSDAPEPDVVKRETFAHFGVPTVAEDRFLSAFTHIFAGGYAAGYYGYKWAEVMSADCYGAFEEVGLGDEAAVAALGRKYRESVLALGGSASALDVFRRFRGRDPEIESLLRQQDLL